MAWVVAESGEVQQDGRGQSVAFYDADTRTVRASRYGSVLAYIDDDGTIKSDRYGKVLGYVESDGTVKADRYGQRLGQVNPPHLRVQAALFLVL